MRREVTVATRLRAKCRVPHCHRDGISRGLCRSCYQSAYQLVAGGTVTWTELERRGKVAAVQTSKSWFLEEVV